MKNKLILTSSLLLAPLLISSVQSTPIVEASTSYVKYSSSTAYSSSNVKKALSKVPDGKPYKIRKNDSIVNIAKAAGVSVKDFVKANGITNSKKVIAGTKVEFRKYFIYSLVSKETSSTKVKDIPYIVEKVQDTSMDEGTEKVTVEGSKGQKEVTTTYFYVNGVKTKASVKEKVTAKPVNKVIHIGVKKKVEIKEDVKYGVIPFSSIVVDDDTMPVGTKKVVKAGVDGKDKRVVPYSIIDGKRVNLSSEIYTVIEPPVQQVVHIGTKLNVEYKSIKKYETIPFTKQTILDGTLPVGTTKITSPGINGLLGYTVHQKIVNNEIVSEEPSVYLPEIRMRPEVTSIGVQGVNQLYRSNPAYISGTNSTDMGYKSGQIDHEKNKIENVRDKVNSTINAIQAESDEAKYNKAKDSNLNSYYTYHDTANQYRSMQLHTNYLTKKAFNDGKIFNEKKFNDEFNKLVNAERAKKGIRPISIGNHLAAGSKVRSAELAEHGSIRVDDEPHVRLDKSPYYTAFPNYNKNELNENLASKTYSGNPYMLVSEKALAEIAYGLWANSAGHYKTMMNLDYISIYTSVQLSDRTIESHNPLKTVYRQSFVFSSNFHTKTQ